MSVDITSPITSTAAAVSPRTSIASPPHSPYGFIATLCAACHVIKVLIPSRLCCVRVVFSRTAKRSFRLSGSCRLSQRRRGVR
jgi:hypothetical protein